MEVAYLVCVKLPLGPQNCVSDIVDEICSSQLAASTQIEAPASIRVVRVTDSVRCRIHDSLQVNEVLHGGCGNGSRSEENASDEHAFEDRVDFELSWGHANLEIWLAIVG